MTAPTSASLFDEAGNLVDPVPAHARLRPQPDAVILESEGAAFVCWPASLTPSPPAPRVGVLRSLLQIANASDGPARQRAVLRFVQHVTPLYAAAVVIDPAGAHADNELAEHLARIAAPDVTDEEASFLASFLAKMESGSFVAEPVALYEQIARKVAGVLRFRDELQRSADGRTVATRANLERAFEGVSLAKDPRRALAQCIDSFLDEDRPILRSAARASAAQRRSGKPDDAGGLDIEIVFGSPRSLIAYELAMRATGRHSIAFCWECREPFDPEAYRGRPGERAFCETHRGVAARREASRTFRRKERAERERTVAGDPLRAVEKALKRSHRRSHRGDLR